MNIYLVKAACGVDWDETKAYVCVAKDENEASSLTSECKGLPNEINNAHTELMEFLFLIPSLIL